MTYILGARCTDGVVLVSDSKVSGGNTPLYEEKLTEVLTSLAVMGGSGPGGLIERFLKEIKTQVDNNQIESDEDLINFIEDRSLELSQKYARRIGHFGVLIGVRSGYESELHNLFTQNGFMEPVKKYATIGSGEPYGAFLLKYLWHEDMSMMDFASLGYFLIRYVTNSELDDSVGGDPTVWFIPDIKEEMKNQKEAERLRLKYQVRPANEDEIDIMEEYSNERLSVINYFLSIMRDQKAITDIHKEAVEENDE